MTCLPPGCSRALALPSLHPVLVATAILPLVVLNGIVVVQGRSIGLPLPCDLNTANSRRQHRGIVDDVDLLPICCHGTCIYEPGQMQNDVLGPLSEAVVQR